MRFGGFSRMDLVNYPSLVAATVFVNGCNFRCPYCHNAPLVRGQADDFSDEEVLSYLSLRQKMLEGVVVTGGEPTLYEELPAFIKKVKAMGFAVKLDTNGGNPEMLKALIARHLVDYVAMDIKTSKEQYRNKVGRDSLFVEESVQVLKKSGILHEHPSYRIVLRREAPMDSKQEFRVQSRLKKEANHAR